MENIKSLFGIGVLLVLIPFQFACSGKSPSSTLPTTANSSSNSNGTASALAIDGNDNLYVLDPPNTRVRVYSSGGTLAQTITGFAIPGQPTITLAYASELALDSARNIYLMIADRLIKFDSNGNFISQITQRGNTYYELGGNHRGLAIDAARGLVFAGDYQRVLIFDTQGNSQGAILSCPKAWSVLRALGVDSQGCVWATDNGNVTIDVWCPCGGGPAGCFNPTAVYNFTNLFTAGAAYNPTIDRSGNLFVAAHLQNGNGERMSKFNPNGSVNTSWSVNPPYNPQSTVVDSRGYVYQSYFNGLIVRYPNNGPPAITIVPASP